jgi:hypothetical protein
MKLAALITVILLRPPPSSALASEVDGHVVQFVVYAAQEQDVRRLFPGADVQFTWNNVYIIQIWTHDPPSVVPEIQSILNKNSGILQVIVPPLTLAAATQKWIEFNLVWVALLLAVFIGGCACGGVIISNCVGIKREAYRKHRCRTGC